MVYDTESSFRGIFKKRKIEMTFASSVGLQFPALKPASYPAHSLKFYQKCQVGDTFSDIFSAVAFSKVSLGNMINEMS